MKEYCNTYSHQTMQPNSKQSNTQNKTTKPHEQCVKKKGPNPNHAIIKTIQQNNILGFCVL